MKYLCLLLLFLLGCNRHNLEQGSRLDPNFLPSGDTAVVLVWGQSNARVGTETWNTLTNYLYSKYSTVRVINIAVSNTNSFQWADKSGFLYNSLVNTIQTENPNFVLCAQGEGDGYTTTEQYFENMKSIIDGVRPYAQNAYYAIALCSYYGASPWKREAVREGQRELERRGVMYLGPDMDQYRPPELGFTLEDNGLHFNNEGYRRIGEDWARVVLRDQF